jgi:hypothetical protein
MLCKNFVKKLSGLWLLLVVLAKTFLSPTTEQTCALVWQKKPPRQISHFCAEAIFCLFSMYAVISVARISNRNIQLSTKMSSI